MNSKKVFMVMSGLLVVALLVLIATVVLGDMLLKKQSDKLLSLKLDNKVLEDQQYALAQANKDVKSYADLEKTAKTIVPQDKDQARTVREIVKIAGDLNIPIASINFPSSTLGTITAKPAAGSTAVTQVKPVVGIPGLYQMEIIVQSDGGRPVPYSSFISFLSKLEQNRRTAQVGNITVMPSNNNGNLVTFTLGINVYIKP